MKRNRFPDAGAYITAFLRNGLQITGFVSEGHAWAFDDEDTLCLAHGADGVDSPPDEGHGENLYQYVAVSEIVAWRWDCRP